jgi:Ca2+-binding EF-hand superfamily protein
MINSISSMGSYMSGMNIQAMQQRRDDMFTKIDSNSDGGIDKAEFSELAKKMSEHTENSISADTVYSTYDTNGDGSLSKDELDSFMKDNAPPPPQMQQAISAYGMNTGTDQTSSLLDLLNRLSSNGSSTSSGTTDSSSDYLSTLLSNLSAMLSSGNISSLLSVQA